MNEKMEEMRKRALEQIRESVDVDKLNEARVAWLGKKGELTAMLKSMKDR